MTRSAEATFWQAVGLLLAMAGITLLGYATFEFGLASINPAALRIGLAASFLILGGAACFVSGRALHVQETKLTAGEARLWSALAVICCVSGAAVVVFTFTQHTLLVMDRLAMGLAGGFAVMMGVICLLGQRVMSHMETMVEIQEREEKAHAANA